VSIFLEVENGDNGLQFDQRIKDFYKGNEDVFYIEDSTD